VIGRRWSSWALSAVVLVASVSHPVRAATVPVKAPLAPAKRAILTRFLTALASQKYPAAFALLTKAEREYFGTAENYASGYLADRAKVNSFTILGSSSQADTTVAFVSESVSFYSYQLASPGSVTAKVAYGIVGSGSAIGIKDPYRPWHVVVPQWSATANGITVYVRKISFYTGRVELVLSFENHGDTTVTILPYGRTVVRDDAGGPHQPIETKLREFTDPELYKGVLLAPDARYTGAMAFFTPDRFTPTSLSATIAPLLADGADAPFTLELPAFTLRK
jgi:hypothetical protein